MSSSSQRNRRASRHIATLGVITPPLSCTDIPKSPFVQDWLNTERSKHPGEAATDAYLENDLLMRTALRLQNNQPALDTATFAGLSLMRSLMKQGEAPQDWEYNNCFLNALAASRGVFPDQQTHTVTVRSMIPPSAKGYSHIWFQYDKETVDYAFKRFREGEPALEENVKQEDDPLHSSVGYAVKKEESHEKPRIKAEKTEDDW